MVECNPCQWLKNKRVSQILILVVIAVGLFVDCLLFTVVGPYNAQDINKTQTSGNEKKCYQDKESLANENLEVGLLTSIKAFVQFVVSPIVGKITSRLGYDLPLFFGFLIVFSSSLMFAFARSFALLAVARAFQGIGSSLTAVPGLSLVSHTFPDNKERGTVMAICSAGMATGALIGPPFGSFMYAFGGMPPPFLTIAFLTLLDGVLRFIVLRPFKISPVTLPPTPFQILLKDPYILLLVGALCICRFNVGVMGITVPIRMMDTMCAPSYQIGLGMIPTAVTYLVFIHPFVALSNKVGRWVCNAVGFIIQGISLICFPLAGNIYELIGPSAFFGIGFALTGSSLYPMLPYLVDLRHTKVYGGLYAISDMAYCFGYFAGPLLGGTLAKTIGFNWLMVLLGLVEVAYAPLFILLRNVPGKDEEKPILNQEDQSLQNNYQDCDQK
ncbi:hypothetical protein GDO86_006730 [Hymenochirus boettgeri]|uniref:Major facilitator superfamily (MFS) profile domain-containing protein n=1 Tax=Hymenochirus boettgeri TaxID=247094 RepID=A0A8T2J791_9PIPI|nr:hypothetical protein GDO86_006730 [Hymenochirus boettgeri]